MFWVHAHSQVQTPFAIYFRAVLSEWETLFTSAFLAKDSFETENLLNVHSYLTRF